MPDDRLWEDYGIKRETRDEYLDRVDAEKADRVTKAEPVAQTTEISRPAEIGQLSLEDNIRFWNEVCVDTYKVNLNDVAASFDAYYEEYIVNFDDSTLEDLTSRRLFIMVAKVINDNEELLSRVPDKTKVEAAARS